jgi:hypothetical protein
MRRILFGIWALMLLLSACAGPAASTPAPTPDAQATIRVLSETMVAATLTAWPTSTPLPPTATPIPSLTATATSPLPSQTPTPTGTATSIPFIGTLAPYGVGNTLPVKAFIIENNTSETLHVVISGVSDPGKKLLYYEWNVTGKFSFDIVWGTFQYTVFVGTKKIFTGSFRIHNYDKTVMRVSMSKVIVVGP